MKVWVFVEGDSDRIALNAIWAKWQELLKKAGWGIRIIPLDNKSIFFKKIGSRVAEKLINSTDLAVGLPDLYPNSHYTNTEYEHNTLDDLKKIQTDLVRESLIKIYNPSDDQLKEAMARFHPSAFKHDSEMLLLAAKEALRQVLGTQDTLGNWRHPVEDQNQTKPPKYVIEELFRTKKKRCYRETTDAKAVLDKISNIKTVLYNNCGQLQCPVFKDMLDWIGTKTGCPCV